MSKPCWITKKVQHTLISEKKKKKKKSPKHLVLRKKKGPKHLDLRKKGPKHLVSPQREPPSNKMKESGSLALFWGTKGLHLKTVWTLLARNVLFYKSWGVVLVSCFVLVWGPVQCKSRCFGHSFCKWRCFGFFFASQDDWPFFASYNVGQLRQSTCFGRFFPKKVLCVKFWGAVLPKMHMHCPICRQCGSLSVVSHRLGYVTANFKCFYEFSPLKFIYFHQLFQPNKTG